MQNLNSASTVRSLLLDALPVSYLCMLHLIHAAIWERLKLFVQIHSERRNSFFIAYILCRSSLQ